MVIYWYNDNSQIGAIQSREKAIVNFLERISRSCSLSLDIVEKDERPLSWLDFQKGDLETLKNVYSGLPTR